MYRIKLTVTRIHSMQQMHLEYGSGAQTPAHGPNPAHRESPCGPLSPIEKNKYYIMINHARIRLSPIIGDNVLAELMNVPKRHAASPLTLK